MAQGEAPRKGSQMPVKPQNCVPVIKDKVLSTPTIDFSGSTATVALDGSLDPDYIWEVIEVSVMMDATYIASQDTTLDVGVSVGPSGAADVDRFVDAVALGTAEIAVGVQTVLTQTSTKTLPAGHKVTVTHTQSASQTGTGIVTIRLRPQELARGNASKRPGASAQSST